MDRPYKPPTSDYGTGDLPGRVSPRILDIMSRTKGWVRFVSVMLFIHFGLTVFNVIRAMGQSSGFGNESERIGRFFGMGIVLLLYIYPAVKLNSYANRIGDLLQSGRAGDLEAALNEHRAFWRYAGIIGIVFLFIFVIMTIVVIGQAATRTRF